jgi:tetratricopeptide (TPR) repeat protein
MKIKYWFISLLFLSFSCSETKNNSEITTKLLLRAKERMENRDFLSAKCLLDSALLVDSSNGEAYFLRGNCKNELDSFKSSSEDYSKSIRYHNKEASSYFNTGLNEIALHRDSNAIIYFKKSLELDSTKTKAIYCVKFCLDRIKFDNENKK